MQQRNIGIFAHVDTGKTTLSEQLLVHSGKVRVAGSVDSGTAHTDTMPVERRRGISVRSACVSLPWKGTEIVLIDTPGHTDFSAEIERSMWALDAGILLVDAADGVQPQTETLFRSLKEQKMPCLIFINKVDRPNADIQKTMRQIHKRLTSQAVLLSEPENVTELVCGADETLTERYLNEETITPEEIRTGLIRMTHAAEAYPVLCGSALKDMGIEALLDAVVELLPEPETKREKLCGVAFSSCSDKIMGRGLWIRLFGGSMKNREAVDLEAGRDPMTGEMRSVQHKITRIRDVSGNDIEVLKAGNVGVVFGLGDTEIGTVFGDPAGLPHQVHPGTLKTPLITVQVIPSKKEQLQALREACKVLSSEDPLLQAEYIRTTEEMHLHVMGRIQLEILQELLKTRFDLDVTFSDPSVIYRETISRAATGFVAYTMPKPCWAIMEFEIEPAPRGSGVSFSSIVPVKDILMRYQHQVEQALPTALKQGRLGWQVTDVRITLTGGNHHQFHTHPLDFILATPWGIHDGLQRGGSTLLEPILEVRFLLPAECGGRVMSDVNQMRGEVLETDSDGETLAMRALIPVATSMDYSTSLASLTSGRGSMSTSLHGYRECPLELGKTAPRNGVDPLDTSRYILAARNALEGAVYD